MQKRLGILMLLLVLLVSAACAAPLEPTTSNLDEQTGLSEEGVAGEAQNSGEFLVLRVVDGDTIEIDYHGTTEKVRLIGIDTPESVHADASKNTPFGQVASDYTKEQLTGKYVDLEFDVEERDKYDRLLAYVYLDGQMFNAHLVEQGYAMVSTYPPNVKYAEDFAALQTAARAANLGLWENFLSSGEYVGSINSDKYHLPGCSSVGQMKEQNQVWFATAAAAEEVGYQACSRCL